MVEDRGSCRESSRRRRSWSNSRCIDDRFSGCNTEGRGEHLFDADGEPAQYLETVLNFLKEYQVQFQRTRAFCSRLKKLDLLEPMQASFTQSDGQRRNLTGFMAVNRTKLKELDDAVLAQMAKNDELELIYVHLQSMGNFRSMLQHIGATPEANDAAEGDAPRDEAEGDGADPATSTSPLSCETPLSPPGRH